jgi:hypothetical protein
MVEVARNLTPPFSEWPGHVLELILNAAGEGPLPLEAIASETTRGLLSAESAVLACEP